MLTTSLSEHCLYRRQSPGSSRVFSAPCPEPSLPPVSLIPYNFTICFTCSLALLILGSSHCSLSSGPLSFSPSPHPLPLLSRPQSAGLVQFGPFSDASGCLLAHIYNKPSAQPYLGAVSHASCFFYSSQSVRLLEQSEALTLGNFLVSYKRLAASLI